MIGLITTAIDDIKVLHQSWGSVRGGWQAARQDAAQLLAHRRLLIDTQALTSSGMKVVLRTRVRLSGDTETDILRDWLDASSPEMVTASAHAHFQSVAAATVGLAAAVGMERLSTRLVIVVGSLGSAMKTIWTIMTTAPLLLLHALLTDWWLLGGVAFMLGGVMIRLILRRRLRAIFRRGLSAPAPP